MRGHSLAASYVVAVPILLRPGTTSGWTEAGRITPSRENCKRTVRSVRRIRVVNVVGNGKTVLGQNPDGSSFGAATAVHTCGDLHST